MHKMENFHKIDEFWSMNTVQGQTDGQCILPCNFYH